MKKAKISDIAREAGVGTATVERVLNARGNVSPETAERVVIAARKLGYDRQLPERHRGIVRIEILMVRPDTPFFVRLNQAFVRIAASLDSSVILQRTFLDERDPRAFANHIGNPGFRRSGLVICAPDHPEVRSRLAGLRESGIPIVQIVTRVNPDDPFVGIDNYAAGRTAAYYLANMLREKAGVLLALCHSGAYEVHRERMRGFSDYLAEHPNPNHDFARIMFGYDDRVQTADRLASAFREHRNIIGLYSAGGGNLGVASVFERFRVSAETMWVGHELTDNTRRWLRSGMMDIVLDQSPEVQARRSVDRVLKQLGVIDVELASDLVPFLTITRENV